MNPRSTSQPTTTKTRKSRTKKEDSQDVAPATTQLADKKEDFGFAATRIPLENIVMPVTQPRRYFTPKAMQSLVESVKRDGILMPLLVRPVGDRYELVAGERRYKAAKDAGLTEVPVNIKQMSDSQAIQYALTENLQREDLNPVEETEGILDLLALRLETDREGAISLLNKIAKVKRGLADNDVRLEDSLLVEEIFKSIGRITPEAFRTHRLPLLKLHIDILEALRSGQIEYTKAREIDKVSSDSERIKLLEAAIEHSLSLSQIREQVKALQPPSESGDLQKLLDKTYKQVKKSKLWSNPDKQEKLKSLLAELQGLLSTED
ncbi:MAG: ParB/RepB/Spo0J family partition protein [Chlorogloeopsis fritschii C42_A2020_084]|uniref:ParB/RepB/Spo0J family partition protein n=1 Tax=Chlorogloeopsis fritschii TaxID=1124 RepID=UPI001A0916BD|nr:ParB/RepB/Spo0J family partition protein [Chlorogloeopsis fritschii]MBF2009492.1 ParB/RepB/Spo0J family partition protein [Chlorogloeopsis fritschii C42_A2020_084]